MTTISKDSKATGKQHESNRKTASGGVGFHLARHGSRGPTDDTFQRLEGHLILLGISCQHVCDAFASATGFVEVGEERCANKGQGLPLAGLRGLGF